MQIAYIVLTVVLVVAALFGLFTFALRKRLKRLEKRFGGNVTSDLFRPAYILEDIKLIYNYGSQYIQGVTTIKVITKPKKPITLEISPKMSLFKIKGETFEELYDCKCIVQDGFPLLTDDLKCFLAANVDCCINLSINPNEFILTTENSPFYIKKIESCMELLLKIKKRINEYESSAQ